MFFPLLTTLALLAQAPSPVPPRVVVPPLEAAGVPAHIVDFGQAHFDAELQRQGLTVVRADTLPGPAVDCALTQPACLRQLAEAGGAQAVVVGALARFPSGFRVSTKAHGPDGRLLAEHVAEGVSEEGLLEALTQAASALAPALQASAPHPAVAQTAAPTATGVNPWPLRGWAWAPATGGAALMGVGTLFLLQARAHHEALERPGSAEPPLDGEAVARAGRQAQTLSRVFYGLGGAGVLAGAVFFFLPGGREGPAGQTRLQVQVGPSGFAVAGVLP